MRGCQGTSEVGDGASGMACTNWELGVMSCPSDELVVAFLACPADEWQSDGLEAGEERRRVGALVLVLVVACGGADGNGCIVVGLPLSKGSAAVSAGQPRLFRVRPARSSVTVKCPWHITGTMTRIFQPGQYHVREKCMAQQTLSPCWIQRHTIASPSEHPVNSEKFCTQLSRVTMLRQ